MSKALAMPETHHPIALRASDVPVRAQRSIYPEPFASMMAGRDKRQLGEAFGLANFGVNLTTLAPGAMSALRHAHSRQDESSTSSKARPRWSPTPEIPR